MDAAERPLTGPAAAGRVFDKLSQRLAELITPVGSEALLRRAVHLSRLEFPFLAGGQLLPNTDPLIDRLRDAAATVDPSQAQAGLLAVLGTLVALLDSFIGNDLTLRLLRDVWPELALMNPDSKPTISRTGNSNAITQ